MQEERGVVGVDGVARTTSPPYAGVLKSGLWMVGTATSEAMGAGAAAAAGNELHCLIEPHVVITVTAPVNGLIESVAVDRGDLVKEGQVLALLDSSVELTTSQISLTRARDNAIDALYRFNAARVNLARSQGRLETLY